MYDITFDNIAASDLGFYIIERPEYPEVKEKTESYDVPFRSGKIYYHTEVYEDVEIKVNINFMSENENLFGEMCRKLNKWINGIYDTTLKFTDDPNFFRKVKFAKVSSVKRSGRLGIAELNFVCDPYMYVVGSDQFKNFSGRIVNNYMLSKPIYRITGNGRCVMEKENKEFQIQISDEIFIDSEKMIAYTESKVANTNVSGFYSTLFLKPGTNIFSINSGFDITFAPYWRTL